MANMVPFNRKNRDVLQRNSFLNMIDDFFSEPWFERGRCTFKVDVQELPEAYIVEAELPGVARDEVRLELNDGTLGIAVERVEKFDEEKKNYIHKERRYSSMCRSIYLGDADAKGIKARLEDGMLRVDIPRQKNAGHSKRIEIQ